jgi:tetratricopeptide (TPR) repeat protein
MAKHKIRQILSAWGLAYYFLVEIVFMYFFFLWFHGKIYGLFAGVLAFLMVLLLQEYIHRGSFRQGIRYLKKNEYNEAIKCFQKSLKYMEKYPFLDRYRHLLLISASEISCKEMALKNIVACYCFLNEKEKATFYYDSLVRINETWKIRMPLIDKFLNSIE